MADLQQVLGAVLRDLAKARFSADLYSRSISRYYEADPLLRKFPVPRADIEEVELDLKFSITDVTRTEVDQANKEASSAVLLERTIDRLVSVFLNEAYSRELRDDSLVTKRTDFVAKGFGSKVLRIEMRKQLMRYFVESIADFVDEKGVFSLEEAGLRLERPFRWAMEEFANQPRPQDPGFRRAMKDALFEIVDPVVKSDSIKAALEDMKEPLERIWQDGTDARLEVVVDGSRLAQLSDAAISSVKVKAVVRNLVWSEVKVDKYTTHHALTAE